MASINVTLSSNENVLALLIESNPSLETYVDGISLSDPSVNGTGVLNTSIVVTALAGSGLQEGSAKAFNYNRLSLEGDATLGSFPGLIYVDQDTTQQAIQEQIILEAGLVGDAIEFADYVAVDFDNDTDGSITVNPIANSKLYIGSLTVQLKGYVPQVADIAPTTDLTGFTSPVE